MGQGFTSDIVIVKPNYADDKEKRKYYCKECDDEFCADFKGHNMPRYLVRRCLDYINTLIFLNCKLLKNLFTNLIFSNLHNMLSILSVSFCETCPCASDLNFSSTSLSVMRFLGWPLGYATFFKNCLPSFVITLITLGIASGYCAVNSLFLTTLTF